MSFASNMRKWADKTGARLEDVTRAAILQVSAQIIERTPVDTGRARANWQASIGTPKSGTLTATDKSGGATVSALSGAVRDAPGRVYYLVNNLPYIRELEYGSSDQAPGGMVRVSARQWKAAIARAAKK